MKTPNNPSMTTGLEFSVSVDTDAIADEPPAGPGTAQESMGGEADAGERMLMCAEVAADHAEATEAPERRVGRFSWTRILAFGVLPALALILALGAGYLKWQDMSARQAQTAGAQSVRAATQSTIAMLSYRPDTVEKDLAAARDRLTGQFKDAYTGLTDDVVIPGAKQKQISAVATVTAAASCSATENHAVVLVFVNQTTIIGKDAPTNTASSVRVTLEKVDGRWLISQFDPI
jgi:Mce-associated membrane protein